jgi:phage shock protein PspC (stress-responsive transcriptional regulator)
VLGVIVAAMTEQPETDKTEVMNDQQVGPRRPLLRSRDDRKIWGVAGGIAEHIGLNATLVRAFFVVTLFFGGAGVLAYLVLAVALPENDGTGQPVSESVWSRLGRVLMVCILVAVGILVTAFVVVASAWVTATGHGTVIAIAVIVFGLGLVAAAFTGDARRRLVPLLVIAGLALGIPAGAVAAADIHIDQSVGQRTYTPTAQADLPPDGYKLGAGQLVVDLRKLPWAKGQTIPVSAHLGFGQMIVSVPPNVCIDARVHGKAGELISGGQVDQGVDPEIDQGSPLTHPPTLKFEGDIQFGQMLITDEGPDDIETHGIDYDHHQQERDSQMQVCGR